MIESWFHSPEGSAAFGIILRCWQAPWFPAIITCEEERKEGRGEHNGKSSVPLSFGYFSTHS